MAFIGTLCLLLILTTLAGHLSNRLGTPSVIGQILVGVVVGPAILNWIHLDLLLNTFSGIGVIILMFIGGLESNLALLRKYLQPAVIVAIIGVIFPVVMIGAASLAFSFEPLEAIFIGVVFSATSVSISVEVLRDYHSLNTKEGATILGAAVADDIIGVILLSIMISIMGTHGVRTGQSADNLILVFVEQIGFFGITYLMVKWIVPYLMQIGERLLMASSVTITSMIICLGMAWLADLVGLSGAVGAFFAGIAVAHTPYRRLIENHMEPIGYALFVPMFFVCIGLNMSFAHIGHSIGFVGVLTVFACLSKLFGCGLGALLNGFDIHSSYMIGSGMISRGEMGLITAQIGFSSGVLSSTYYSDLILVIILSTMIAPFLLKHAIHHLPQPKKVNLPVV
ncbi:cation:proton antiporter [Lentilactobacillus hilgardii]|uniref:Sodium:proton antiporter n=1 Tax=Lentilactobacillus hilgardii TaxID=1588 RepID=A0A6P1EH23_LENHI|nr:cation:proton antiporter [Lentilactobacillus hilgardii]EEI72394.1 transporter, CPA2 family [Lentilactobacillus hilgardii ATCC 27305]MCT3392290.1 cation:proton antiporter [Lentilactobacillus hilgardii]QHB53294.1 sodium:proton antiporter [Lentilactobacillus hilgardii]RRG08986.1 MAG: cation:proton antiporter [Lactobacillus sp.]